jgi:hypothetical protein
MENFKRWVLAALFGSSILLAHQSLAYSPQEGKITATLGPYINTTNFSGSDTVPRPGYLGGYSIVAVGDISSSGSLEIAMIYLPSMLFVRDEGGKYQVENTQVMHITMGYRWWLNPYFSTSLAFYSAYSIGDPNIVHSDFVPTNTIDTSARDTTEYGFDWAVQGELWSNDRWAAIAEGRYSLSVTSKKNEHSDQYGIMIGARYLVQEDKVVEKRQPQ